MVIVEILKAIPVGRRGLLRRGPAGERAGFDTS
jgi:hypothetical protein